MYHWFLYLSASSRQGPNTYMKLKTYYCITRNTKWGSLICKIEHNFLNNTHIHIYPLLDSSFKTSSTLSMLLYCIPVTIPPGFDKVTFSMPFSITTCIWIFVTFKTAGKIYKKRQKGKVLSTWLSWTVSCTPNNGMVWYLQWTSEQWKSDRLKVV